MRSDSCCVGMLPGALMRNSGLSFVCRNVPLKVENSQSLFTSGYDAGERSILELLDAYRTGATARVRQATLDGAVRQAEIELEFASGWEIQQ